MVIGSVKCTGYADVYNDNGEVVRYISNGTSWRVGGSAIIDGEECYKLYDDKWIPKRFITFKGGIVNEESNRYV